MDLQMSAVGRIGKSRKEEKKLLEGNFLSLLSLVAKAKKEWKNLGRDMKKMKTKILVLVGIVVCAVLLTSPALASAGYSKIYGNANEDDVLDMRDVTYIKLLIFGKKPATTFADANADGKISMLDIGQTKLIILGKEKQLTLVDMADRTVTVPRPIERVVTVHPDATRPIIALGAGDKLVGLGSYDATSLCRDAKDCPLCAATVCGGKLFELPMVGMYHQGLNLELILSLKPAVVFAPVSYNAADSVYEKTGIPSVSIKSGGHQFDEMNRMMEFMGTLLEKQEEAEELISFFEETIGKIEEVTSEIPEEEKPKVYFSTRGVKGTGWSKITRTVNRYDPLDTAGGINVAKEVLPEKPGSTSVDVSKEQIIKWNPDIIVIACSRLESEGESDIERVLSDPDLKTVNAIKSESVYYCIYPYSYGLPADKNMVNMIYLAKLFHPDKFEDLDVEEEGNEIFKAFLRADGLFSEYADYTGWMGEWLDSQK